MRRGGRPQQAAEPEPRELFVRSASRYGRPVVTMRARDLGDACGHLERLTGATLRPFLAGRAGLRAAIMIGGVILVGDSIEVMPESDP